MLQQIILAGLVVSCFGEDLPWWKVGPIYQIFPASFADSDGDGWGDLQGIIDHADYLQDIGVGAIWLSPIYPSPMKDNGYDVTNFTDVNPRFGNLTVFDKLIEAFHGKQIKVVLDFVPNHSSNESQWFLDSVHRRNGKDDWYVWRDPRGFDSATGEFIPPNNWVSTFGGSAWKFVPERKQFYYHKFAPYQTDFNYSNPEVLEEMKETLRFWLRRGVDGFRMDAVPFIGETNYGMNEPLKPNCYQNATNDCLQHIYTMNVQLTHEVLNSFDSVLREDQFVHNGSIRAMWEEANNDVPELMTYYGNVSSPFNFQYITYIQKDWNATEFNKYTMDFMAALNGTTHWPNWVVGNHDNPRIGTRMGPEMIDSMNIIAQLLPGTSITYYGEEIGMENMKGITEAQRKDNATNPSRDPARTPMQWNLSSKAGFSSADSKFLYLPVHSNYYLINVQNERNDSKSHLGIYKKVVKMHKDYIKTTQKGFKTGTSGQWIFGFQRFCVRYSRRTQSHSCGEQPRKLPISSPVPVSLAEKFTGALPFTATSPGPLAREPSAVSNGFLMGFCYLFIRKFHVHPSLRFFSYTGRIQRPGLVVATNLNNQEETFTVDSLWLLPKTKTPLTVALAPPNVLYEEGTTLSSSANITLKPRSTIVFTTGGSGYLQISSLLLAAACLLHLCS